MTHQKTESRWPLLIAIRVAFFVGIALGHAPSFAQSSPTDTAELSAALEALERQDYEEGIQLLDQAQATDSDPRVNYYRGFAFEKLGECVAAKRQYELARSDASSPGVQRFANDALADFDARCTPATSVAEPSFEAPAIGSSSVPWQIFGWVTVVVGTLAIAAVPVKNSLENSALDQATPYFEERYGCSITRGEISGTKCERSELESDSKFSSYQDRVALADRTSDYLLVGGIATVAVGATTLIALMLNSAEAPVSAGISTNSQGFRAQIGVEF